MKALALACLLALIALLLVGCDDSRRDILGGDPIVTDPHDDDRPQIHPPRLDPCIFARGDDERCDDETEETP